MYSHIAVTKLVEGELNVYRYDVDDETADQVMAGLGVPAVSYRFTGDEGGDQILEIAKTVEPMFTPAEMKW